MEYQIILSEEDIRSILAKEFNVDIENVVMDKYAEVHGIAIEAIIRNEQSVQKPLDRNTVKIGIEVDDGELDKALEKIRQTKVELSSIQAFDKNRVLRAMDDYCHYECYYNGEGGCPDCQFTELRSVVKNEME